MNRGIDTGIVNHAVAHTFSARIPMARYLECAIVMVYVNTHITSRNKKSGDIIYGPIKGNNGLFKISRATPIRLL